MKLYLLEPVDETDNTFWYDCAWGFVIRAKTKKEARQIAHENGGDESSKTSKPWLDPKITNCTVLTAKGDIGVVLRDFYAG
jgi:hypothetical protein